VHIVLMGIRQLLFICIS